MALVCPFFTSFDSHRVAKRGKIAVQFSPGTEKQENVKKNNVNEANIFKMQSPKVLLGNKAKFYEICTGKGL